MENTKSVYVFRNDVWVEAKFTDLKKGDIFRLFDPDGTPIVGSKKQKEFLATSEAYQRKSDGLWTVNVEE